MYYLKINISKRTLGFETLRASSCICVSLSFLNFYLMLMSRWLRPVCLLKPTLVLNPNAAAQHLFRETVLLTQRKSTKTSIYLAYNKFEAINIKHNLFCCLNCCKTWQGKSTSVVLVMCLSSMIFTATIRDVSLMRSQMYKLVCRLVD